MLLWNLLAQLFSIFIGIYSYNKKSVTISGLVAMLVVSTLFIWSNQIGMLLLLFAMYTSSSLLTKFKEEYKHQTTEVKTKSGPRDATQAFCNLGIATLSMILFLFTKQEYCLVALAGSVASANADSWASEIGGLSNQTPRLITNFKKVPKGMSGGITRLGLTAGLLGSGFITLVYHFVHNLFTNSTQSTLTLWSVFIAGSIGCIADSYLGAIFQALYKEENNFLQSEIPSPTHKLQKGIRWINNDVVNLLTTTIGALIAGCLYASNV